MREKPRNSSIDKKEGDEGSDQSEKCFRLNMERNLSSSQKAESLELADIIDVQAIQPLMDEFYKLTHIPIGLNDLKGNALAGSGWQDICIKFHRIHPETSKYCVESNIKLSEGVFPGKIKMYRCKNNMWDIVTPIIVSDQHVGYVFAGQFFFEEESLDYELFRAQARKYGFDEKEYIGALEKVPRLSREAVNTGMAFFMTFANMFSQLSYSNIKLAQLLEERDTLANAQRESEKRYLMLFDHSKDAIILSDPRKGGKILSVNPAACRMLGRKEEELIGRGRELMFDMEDPAASDVLNELMCSGSVEAHLTYRRKDGTKFPGELSTTLFTDSNGEPRAVIIIRDITERKKAEEKLRLASKYNRSLIEASLDPFVTIGPDGKITDVNNSTEKVTGYSRDELIGTDFSEYFTEPEKAKEGYQQVFQEGLVRDYPLEIQHKDGHITPVLYNASVYKDETGKVIGIFAAARDITELKKAEKALQKAHNNLEKNVKARTIELEEAYNSLMEEERRLSEAQKIAHIGNWDWNTVTDEVYWSDEMYHIFGLAPLKLGISYNKVLDYIHPEDRKYVNNAVKKALNGNPFDIDYRIILPDGEERVVHGQGEVVFDEKRNPTRMRGTIQDITERKKAEERIQILANVVESSDDGILTESFDGIITSWNNGAERVFGYSAEEIIGKPISCLEPGIIAGETKKLAALIKQGESIQQYETLRLRKDDKIINVSITLSPVFNIDGKLAAISVIYRDITKRKEAEEALANIEIARQKEIHHRIKNNLQVISSLLDLEAEKFSNKEQIQSLEVLEAFRESQDRVISIALIHEELHEEGETTDTLNFSLYLQRLVKNLFHTYKLGNTNVYLNLELQEDIFFNMDTAVPLGMIVNELVSNSLKYAFSDRKNGEIRIKLFSKETSKKLNSKEQFTENGIRYTLIVSDNGIGISRNINVENSDTLGLQLVNLLVDQLDGTIELKRDKGTEFIIKFTALE